jgi:hypothetical protein
VNKANALYFYLIRGPLKIPVKIIKQEGVGLFGTKILGIPDQKRSLCILFVGIFQRTF